MKPSLVSTAAHPSYISDLAEITALYQVDKTHMWIYGACSPRSLETASVQ